MHRQHNRIKVTKKNVCLGIDFNFLYQKVFGEQSRIEDEILHLLWFTNAEKMRHLKNYTLHRWPFFCNIFGIFLYKKQNSMKNWVERSSRVPFHSHNQLSLHIHINNMLWKLKLRFISTPKKKATCILKMAIINRARGNASKIIRVEIHSPCKKC